MRIHVRWLNALAVLAGEPNFQVISICLSVDSSWAQDKISLSVCLRVCVCKSVWVQSDRNGQTFGYIYRRKVSPCTENLIWIELNLPGKFGAFGLGSGIDIRAGIFIGEKTTVIPNVLAVYTVKVCRCDSMLIFSLWSIRGSDFSFGFAFQLDSLQLLAIKSRDWLRQVQWSLMRILWLNRDDEGCFYIGYSVNSSWFEAINELSY